METRSKLAVVVIIIAGFADTGCATGGYLGSKPYRGPLGDVVAGNLALTCPGDYFIGPPVNRCLRHLTSIGPQFLGYPIFAGGPTERSLSRTEKIAVLGGVGAVIGGTITRDWKGAVIGGAIGTVATAVATRGRNDQQVSQQGQKSVRVIDPNLWGTGDRLNCLQQGLVTLRNLTGEILGIFEEGADPENDDPLGVLQPRESRCGDPNLRYEAWVRQTAVSADKWVGSTQRVPRRPEARPGLVLVWR